MQIKLEDTVSVFATTNDDTGAAVNADSTPTVTVYKNGTAVVGSPSMTAANMTNVATSLYSHSRKLGAAADDGAFAAGDYVSIVGTAVVDGITSTAVLLAGVIVPTVEAANVTQWSGTAVATVDTAGYPKVTIKSGTGTGEASLTSGRVKADVSYWNAAAIAAPDTAGYPKVTVKSGAGTGELDVTSGVVKSNLSAILGTALTQTYSIATAFKNFFDVLTARLTCSSYNLDGDLWTRVGSPATTSISADIAAVKTVADDVPTTAEFNARTLAAADYGTAASIAALNNLSAAQVATELATYDAPTNAEMVARTLLAADYATATAVDAVPTAAENRAEMDSNSTKLTSIDAKTTNLPTDPADASVIASLIAALPADVRTNLAVELARIDAAITTRATPAQVATELATYDAPTNAEMVARTLVAASYATAGGEMTLADAEDIYPADIQCTIDEANERDEYTVQWFRNGAPVTSGVTVPLVQVIKRADGTDLIASTAMTQIGSTGACKYDTTTTAERKTAGEAVLVHVSATINGSTRTWRKLITRDSAEA